jgi:esterase
VLNYPYFFSKTAIITLKDMAELLNYNQQGEGEPLLIIHGLFGSSRNWKTLAGRFAENYRVITLDLRNHGDSFHAPSMSYADMVQDILTLIDALKIECTHIIGHSMGGKVAMKLAQENPSRVCRLVVADVAPLTYPHDYDEIIDPVMALDLTTLRNRRDADERLQQTIIDQRIRLFILQNLEFNQGIARWKLNWSAIRDNMPEITGYEDISSWSVETPSLFIRGEQSGYINAEGTALIEQHFSDCQFKTIENAGHWLHAEQPEAFYRAVRSFLAAS